ncbi:MULTISPECIES: hypothetical protein [unclassified Acidisoma]|jgi:hypothetical protein|nr:MULTISPECIES: hypothetical protein [unclassified Acidisoma]
MAGAAVIEHVEADFPELLDLLHAAAADDVAQVDIAIAAWWRD